MNQFYDLVKKLKRLAFATAVILLAVLALTVPFTRPAHGQATTAVRPRINPVINGYLLGSKQYLATNAWNTNCLVAGFTNTFIPFGPAHPIGLVATIISTNTLQNSSNMIVYVYPAYDLGGGNSTGIGTAFGVDFLTNTAMFTWTIAYPAAAGTNEYYTNLLTSLWEPATALGYTVSNACTSNILLTLKQMNAP